MTYNNPVSFVLTDADAAKKIKVLDVVTDKTEDVEEQAQLFDAQFALMSAELRLLFDALVASQGGFKDSGDDLVEQARASAEAA